MDLNLQEILGYASDTLQNVDFVSIVTSFYTEFRLLQTMTKYRKLLTVMALVRRDKAYLDIRTPIGFLQ